MSDSVSTMNPSGGVVGRRGLTPPSLHDDLMVRIVATDNVRRAWKRVRANKGAPGIDGLSIVDFPDVTRTQWPAIRQALLEGTYQPQPVRRVSIPKPGGRGERLLGIPTVMDRLIQQSIAQVLTPIFDPQFSVSSFGFRPKRSAHGAVRQVQAHISAGFRTAVDLDLAKFFDTVNHDVLMNRVARRIDDKRVLKLIGRYLRAGVLVGGNIEATDIGTPQGGPLSPLLANILLDDLDKELERRGHRFARYADDLVILVKSVRAGDRVKSSISAYLADRLKLSVNEQKSRVLKTNEMTFLGFMFRGKKLRWTQDAFADFQHQIRKFTGRSWGVSMTHRFRKLAEYARGWMQYFGISDYYRPVAEFDSWLRRRVRMCYWKQWRHVRTKARHLLALGVSKSAALMTAASGKSYWHLSKSIATQTGMTNEWLEKQGLINIRALWMKAHGYA